MKAKNLKTKKETPPEAGAVPSVEAANARYEARQGGENAPSIAAVEREFGLRPNQLRNWRLNQAKLKSAVAKAAGSAPAGEGPSLVGQVGEEAAGLAVDAEIRLIDIDDTENDPDNTRTAMDAEKLDGLADSIRQHGIRQNCEAIWNPATKKWRIITGNRRRVATRMAVDGVAEDLRLWKNGLAMVESLLAARGEKGEDLEGRLARIRKIPCRILPPTEEGEYWRIKTLQLIENLQKEDIDPIDEARGFDWLVVYGGQTPESIARSIGCTRELINQRRKMLRAPKAMLDALRAGKVGTRVVELVASIPGEIDREVCAGMVLKPKMRVTPLNGAEVEELIARDFKKTLKGAPWDLKDAELDAEAGSCAGCAFRTGNMPEFEDQLAGSAFQSAAGKTGVDPWVCTKPECYRRKAGLHGARAAAAAAASGAVILPPGEAERLFAGPDGGTAFDAKFARLTDKPTSREVGHFDDTKVPTWGELFERAEMTPPPIAVVGPDGVLIPVCEKASMREALSAALNEKRRPNPFDTGASPAAAKRSDQKKSRDGKKATEKAGLDVLGRIMEKVFALPDDKTSQLLLAMIALEVEASEDAQFMLRRILGIEARGLKDGRTVADEIADFIAATDRSLNQLLAYLVGTLLSGSARWNAAKAPDLAMIAEFLGVKMGKESEGKGKKAGLRGGLFSFDVWKAGERGDDGWHVVNEHGVFNRPDVIEVFTRKDKTHRLAICLAETEAGWYSAHQYDRSNASGGGLPSLGWRGQPKKTVSEAILAELRDARRRFRPSDNPMVKAAPAWVDESICDAIRALGGDPDGIDGDEEGQMGLGFGEKGGEEEFVLDADLEPRLENAEKDGWVAVQVKESTGKGESGFVAEFPLISGACRDGVARAVGGGELEAIGNLIRGHFGDAPAVVGYHCETKNGKIYRCLLETVQLSREGGEEE